MHQHSLLLKVLVFGDVLAIPYPEPNPLLAVDDAECESVDVGNNP